MIVANFTTVRPEMGDTRTYESFYKFLGTKPEQLGVVTRMYDDYTASFLTEGLRNVIYRDAKSKDKYSTINSMYFDWGIETNQIKRIMFAAIPEGDGAGGTDITMAFTEKYYNKYDIFTIDRTRQQCMVLSHPIRKADKYWEYTVRLIDNDYKSVLEFEGCQPGMTTRFQSNAVPELSDEGWVKYQSNVEKHRGYITTHRVDDSYSGQYAAFEDQFISIASGDGTNKPSEKIYKMDKLQKNLLDNFMYVRNNGLIYNKCNVNPKTGKPTIYDPDTNRPIYIGDGILPQIEKFAYHYVFNHLTIDVFNTMLATLNEKSEKPTGNEYVVIVNERLWQLIQTNLLDYLQKFKVDSTCLWSMKANGYVKVGASFDSYEFGGNTIVFKVDRSLTNEFGSDKGFGMCLNLTPDKTTNQPPIAMFTLKGADFVTNSIAGVGGLDGMTSGPVASPVAGSRLIDWGYSGVAVFNPYRSYIIMEA